MEARLRVAQYLPPKWQPSAASPQSCFRLQAHTDTGAYLLRQGVDVIASTKNLEEILEALESALHFEVACRARRRLFVHAGVVGWRGRVLVLPGASRSGKTTLVEALVRAGGTYFSDEYAVIDEGGLVHPYPKALSVRVHGSARPRRIHADQLGGTTGTEPWPIGLMAALQYRPDRGWDPQPLGAGEALLALLGHTVVARARPAFALRVLSAGVGGVRAVQGYRGAATRTAEFLLKMMDHTTPQQGGGSQELTVPCRTDVYPALLS